MKKYLPEISLALVLAWVIWGFASLILPTQLALFGGVMAGAVCVMALRSTIVVRGVMAVLDPIGIVLPLLILRQMAGALGLHFPPFATWELLLFLALYIPFLAASLGALPFDPYRLGYIPHYVAVLALGLCIYGILTENWTIPLIALAGQALWNFKIGSSNYFDHITHATLVPVVVVVLIGRLFT